MKHHPLRFISLALFLVSTTVLVSGQVRTKEEKAKLFADLAHDEKAVAICEKTIREEQIKKFGKPLPRVSGDCFSGCPVRVVKPLYPTEAKRLKISGDVVVDTIVGEKGE